MYGIYAIVLGDTDDTTMILHMWVDDVAKVQNLLIRYFRHFVTLKSTFRLYWNYPSTIRKVT